MAGSVLLRSGVDPRKLLIGHADTFLNAQYHAELLAMDVSIAFDTIGRHHSYPDAWRAERVAELLDEGWSNHLMLSSDRCYRSDLKTLG